VPAGSWRVWIPIYLVVTLATGFADLHMRPHAARAWTAYVPEVVDGTAEAPGRYRVLAPFLERGLERVSGLSPASAWYLTRLAWILAAYAAFHLYLRTWFEHSEAGAGTLLVAATVPLTFTNSWGHPDHFPELALFTLGCLAAARGADRAFAATLVVAALNRETAGFLVAVYALAGPMNRARLGRTALFGLLFLAVFGGLRAARGFALYDYWQLGRNLEFLALLPPGYDPYYRAYAWFVVALFGPLAWLVLTVRRQLPWFPRHVPLVAIPFVVVAVTLSSIIETRIFTPLFPLLVPAVMFAVFPPDKRNGSLTGTRDGGIV
jgi:hypothetical protein